MPKNIELNNIILNGYTGQVVPARRQQKISDEDLSALFMKIKDKWVLVTDLKAAIGEVIPINADNLKRSPIGSGYLERMSKMTGESWRQKSGFTPDGKRLVKVFTQGKYKPREKER